MSSRQWFLSTYQLVLQLYPTAFRKRFAPEMLELAASAEPGEWPLFLADTGMAIVRCWMEGSPSTVAAAEPNAYVPLGSGAAMSASGLAKGLAVSLVVTLGLCYAIYLWPPPCPDAGHIVTPIVSVTAPQARTDGVHQPVKLIVQDSTRLQ
jgi:hypothetical protein